MMKCTPLVPGHRRSTAITSSSYAAMLAIVILTCVALPARAQSTTLSPTIVVRGGQGVPISPLVFGTDNIWYDIASTGFDAFSKSMQQNVGASVLRYPGGFESEHYNWSDNSLEPSYRNYTSTPGATPFQAIEDWGDGHVTFVMRTADAIDANTAQAYQQWANQAASLVSEYGGQVQDWEIGNEWYNLAGAGSHPNEYLQRYSKIVSYFVPAMEAAAQNAGYNIHIYITSNWRVPELMQQMQSYVDPAIWAEIYGVDIHVYTGFDPGGGAPGSQPQISEVGSTIHQIEQYSGKNHVYVSEWAADLNDNDGYGGLKDANEMMQLFGQFGLAGVTEAAYWPPLFPTSPQNHKIALVRDSSTYTPLADGQAFLWLSQDYRGLALKTEVQNSTVSAIAAREPDGKIAIYIMTGGEAPDETENIKVEGFPWSQVVSAQALWNDDANINKGPAQIADIPTSVMGHVDAKTVQLTVNPGGTDRGGSYEIVKLILGGGRPSDVSAEYAATHLTYPGATHVTACVNPSGSKTPTGSVQIFDDTTLLTTQPIRGNGCAYWYISPGLAVGSHEFTVQYSGDANNPAGQSAPTEIIVDPVPVKLGASCWNASFNYGGNYQCTVNASSDAGAAKGVIDYALDGNTSVSVPLMNGNAKFAIPEPAVGAHNIAITYPEQGNYAAASAGMQGFTVELAPVQLALTPSTWYAAVGTGITFQASVRSWSAGAPPGVGDVIFSDAGKVVATVPVNENGQASYVTSGLAAGSHTITATYVNGGNYSSGSASVTITLKQ